MGTQESFLLRWRGRQEGPYALKVIQRKLAAGEIGLLHEVLFKGRWRALRDYLAEEEATRQAELLAQREAERLAKEAERKAREIEELDARRRQEQERATALAEEKRKNDLLEQFLAKQGGDPGRTVLSPLRPHRGGAILAFSLVGLLICFPFSIAAWIMGSGDLQQMDGGEMDPGGRSLTSAGRAIGIVGTVLWCGGLLLYLLRLALVESR